MLTATPEARPSANPWKRLAPIGRAASRPVAADSVAVFRILFGLLVAYSSVRFLAKGWVDTLYLEPVNHLTFGPFAWVRPLPSTLMHLHVAALAALGVAIAAGYRHRLATGLFIVGFAYTELIEASLYLNHYWFVTLTATLLWLLPVHHHWSLDARAGRVEPRATVASWLVWALQAQLAVVYVFAGLAKLNSDWLVRAQPMQLWLTDRTDIPGVGPFLDETFMAYAASWLGAVFDCTIVAWLLWRRSRPLAYMTLIVFHLATGALFQIGVFPWVMIALTTIFFAPSWPQQWIPTVIGRSQHSEPSPGQRTARVRPITAAVLVAFSIIQIALPLRHYAAPGNVRWNEDGYYLSWRVMLTEKAGHLEFQVTDPSTNESWQADPELVLTDWQSTHAATRPDLIHATAHLIADHYRAAGLGDLEVRADVWVSMNGRAAARIVDPSVDLAGHARGDAPTGWILDP